MHATLPYLVAKGFFNRKVPRWEFLQATADNTNNTTYTFSAQNLGTPHQNRVIVVACHAEDALATFTLSSGTVNGVSATMAISGAPANTVVSGILVASVPAGTTGDIAVTWSEAVTSCAIGVYALYNYRPVAEGLWNTTEATGTGSMSVGENDSREPHALTIAASSNVGGETATWNSVTAGHNGWVTEHYDADSAELGYSGASNWMPPVEGKLSAGLSVDWSGTGEGDLVGITFLPRYHRFLPFVSPNFP